MFEIPRLYYDGIDIDDKFPGSINLIWMKWKSSL